MRNFFCTLLTLALCFLVPGAPASAQPERDELQASLLTWIQREVGLKNIPSLSIALVDDQQVVMAASIGYADPKAKELATPDTPYRVGSVSKPFTALLLMIFVELGLIDL